LDPLDISTAWGYFVFPKLSSLKSSPTAILKDVLFFSLREGKRFKPPGKPDFPVPLVKLTVQPLVDCKLTSVIYVVVIYV
jgi:hypothetical protein